MRRLLLSLALAGLLIGAFWALDAHAVSGPCRGRTVPGLIACAVNRWSVPGGLPKARSVAWCESHFDPQATSPDGRWRGVYQLGTDEFYGWGRSFPMMWSWFSRPHNVHKARQNVFVAIRHVHATGSWSGWSCA